MEGLYNKQLDHKQPLTRGGSDWISNVQWLCRLCNMLKARRTQEEWEAYVLTDHCRKRYAFLKVKAEEDAQKLVTTDL